MSIAPFKTIQSAPGWLEQSLLKSDLSSLIRYGEGGWQFGFSDHCTLTTSALWRIVGSTSIILTSEDHGQQFGLPAPVDVCERAMEALPITLRITAVSILPATADLRISFGHSASLEVINTSSGYEGWHLHVGLGSETLELVAVGGGGLSIPAEQRE